MKIIDVIGKPCPIPVIESKKALSGENINCVLVKVDNIVAVQNLEKMAKGYEYSFSYAEKNVNMYEVIIDRDGKSALKLNVANNVHENVNTEKKSGGLLVVIGANTMGEGKEELGKILIKGFIYSLTELSEPPKNLIFLNSGAYLTTEGSNTIEDLKRLEEKGVKIYTCGTCINYYSLQDKLAVGEITDMYGITEKMASACNIINI